MPFSVTNIPETCFVSRSTPDRTRTKNPNGSRHYFPGVSRYFPSSNDSEDNNFHSRLISPSRSSIEIIMGRTELDENSAQHGEKLAVRDIRVSVFPSPTTVATRSIYSSEGKFRPTSPSPSSSSSSNEASVRGQDNDDDPIGRESSPPLCRERSSAHIPLIYEQYLAGLNLSKTYFDMEYNTCFCSACYLSTEPDFCVVAKSMFTVPRGWMRFGLKVNRSLIENDEIFQQWCTTFYGISKDYLEDILKQDFLPFPGDHLSSGRVFGTRHLDDRYIYTSPSIHYAVDRRYYPKDTIKLNDQLYDVEIVLQCKQHPQGIERQSAYRSGMCSIISSNEIEWKTKQRSSIVPYGLLIRLTKHPFTMDKEYGSSIDLPQQPIFRPLTSKFASPGHVTAEDAYQIRPFRSSIRRKGSDDICKDDTDDDASHRVPKRVSSDHEGGYHSRRTPKRTSGDDKGERYDYRISGGIPHRIRSGFEASCPKNICKQYSIENLRLDKGYFNFKYNQCYCDQCHPATKTDRFTVANSIYTAPKGWVRFGLQVNKSFADSKQIFTQWCTSFYGTSKLNLEPILKNRFIPFPKDQLLTGETLHIRLSDRDHVYTSPSIHYASLSHVCPTDITKIDNNWYDVQVVLECKQNPQGTIKQQGCRRGVCSIIADNEIEWKTSNRSSVVPYGLLIRARKHRCTHKCTH